MNYSSEEADKVFEVANAIPVNRSIKVIPINISWFLFIITEIFGWFVFMLIYPRSKMILVEKIEKLL